MGQLNMSPIVGTFYSSIVLCKKKKKQKPNNEGMRSPKATENHAQLFCFISNRALNFDFQLKDSYEAEGQNEWISIITTSF